MHRFPFLCVYFPPVEGAGYLPPYCPSTEQPIIDFGIASSPLWNLLPQLPLPCPRTSQAPPRMIDCSFLPENSLRKFRSEELYTIISTNHMKKLEFKLYSGCIYILSSGAYSIF